MLASVVIVTILLALATSRGSEAFQLSSTGSQQKARLWLPSFFQAQDRVVASRDASNAVLAPFRTSLRMLAQANTRHTIVADEESEEEEEEGEEEEAGVADSAPIIIEQEEATISLIKEGIKFPTNLNGSDVRVGIIMGRWNADVIQGLYKGVNESLTQCGVKPSNVFTTFVPGSFELPITAKFLAASKRVDVIICLGCLIKGETMHFEYIAQTTASGIMQVSLDSFVPCIFGVLTVLNKEQAVKRSTGETNEGLSWGRTAVEMGLARQSALGMDRKQKTDDDVTPFVTFNATMPVKTNTGNDTSATPSSSSSSSKKPRRKFGF